MISTYQGQPETVTARFDRVARAEPGRHYATIVPASSIHGKEFLEQIQSITIGELQHAIDAAAWWFKETFEELDINSPIVYIGPQDLRYVVFLLGADKAGLCLLLLSPRNSVSYHVHCMKESHCKTVLRDKAVDFQNVRAELPFRDVVAPSFEDISSRKSTPFPHKPDLDKTLVKLHSSGSTGMPKVLSWTHRAFWHLTTFNSSSGYGPALWDELAAGPVLSCFPMFHAAGLFAAFVFTLQYNHSIIFMTGMPRPDTIFEAIRNLRPSILFVPPSIVESCWEDKANRDTLKLLKTINFGGGPLRSDIGNEVAKHIHLQAAIGTSECGILPLVLADAEDFDYLCFPDLPGMVFTDIGNGLYQMYFKRDPITDEFHCTWLNYPELELYDTKDLYTKHPTKPRLWKHAARADNVLLLRNGEKVVPFQLEDILLSSNMIKGIVMLGNSRTEVAALIEAKSDVTIADLLPYIQRGNKTMPGHARLSSDRILFAEANRPFVYTPKGTVMRTETIALYKKDIDRLYDEVPVSDATIVNGTTNGHSSTESTRRQSTIAMLRQTFAENAGISDLQEDDDLFVRGVDSVGVAAVVRALKRALPEERPELVSRVSLSLIYNNPSLGRLADYLDARDRVNNQDANTLSREEVMQQMLSRYAKSVKGLTVILTGSTGSLGSYLLDSLLQRSDVKHIYVLNRTSDAGQRQLVINKQRKLSTDQGRVTFIQSDLSKPQLGLSSEDYKRLQLARLIIHNQWEVNFHLPLAAFEPHLAGLSNLIDLASKSAARIFFTSSIGAVREYGSEYPGRDIPEKVYDNPRVASAMGYAESKFIAEQMLLLSDQPTTVARIGQIAGPVQKTGGVWNTKEWLPSLLMSSAHLKLLPTDLDDVDWIPVDILADAIVELATGDMTRNMQDCQVYNICNPRTIKWSQLMPIVLRYLPDGTTTCSLARWTQAVAASGNSLQNPAATLIGFYKGLSSEANKTRSRMTVQNAVNNSKTMQELSPVTSAWMELWLKSWGLSQSKANGIREQSKDLR